MLAWIYQIRNIATDQRYIGSTVDITTRARRHFTELQHNSHHNIYLQRSYNKHGADLFVFEILLELDIDDNVSAIREVEQQYLDTGVGLFNIGQQASGGDNLSQHPNKSRIQQQKGDAIKRHRASLTPEERSARYGRRGAHNGMFGKTHSHDTKLELSELAKRRAAGSSLVVGNSRRGKTNTELFGEEQANDISSKLSSAGKLRVGDKNPFFGKHHTDEVKQQASTSRIDRHRNMTVQDKLNHPQMRTILVDGRLYFGVAEAATDLGCTASNVVYKLKSVKYPNYSYITKEEAVNYLQTLSVMKSDDGTVWCPVVYQPTTGYNKSYIVTNSMKL